MTLAPERPDVHAAHAALAPTEPHHEGATHTSAPHHALGSRLSVDGTSQRPQRPLYKKSGRPNPAAHLSPAQIEHMGRELDAIRAKVMDSRGARDAAYIRRVIATQRYLEMGGRVSLLFSNVKVKGVRPFWWAGTAALTLAKILENMEIGHNVLHGQWDWMRDPKISSTTWDWDFVTPAAQWKRTHNVLHHTYTNVLDMDTDLGYGIFRVDPDQEWRPGFLWQPLTHWLNAAFFEFGIAAYDVKVREAKRSWDTYTDEQKATFRREGAAVLKKVRDQALKDYVVHPLLSAPTGSALTTLAGTVTANIVRNVWANTVIVCGHFPEGVATFEVDSIEGETKGEWYLRQMMGSGNISGSKLLHIMTGNLSHQIEHHLFPDMPSNRLGEIAPRVRALMERHDLPYVTGPILRQFVSVYSRMLRLSVPNKVVGESRLTTLRKAMREHRKGGKVFKPTGVGRL